MNGTLTAPDSLRTNNARKNFLIFENMEQGYNEVMNDLKELKEQATIKTGIDPEVMAEDGFQAATGRMLTSRERLKLSRLRDESVKPLFERTVAEIAFLAIPAALDDKKLYYSTITEAVVEILKDVDYESLDLSLQTEEMIDIIKESKDLIDLDFDIDSPSFLNQTKLPELVKECVDEINNRVKIAIEYSKKLNLEHTRNLNAINENCENEEHLIYTVNKYERKRKVSLLEAFYTAEKRLTPNLLNETALSNAVIAVTVTETLNALGLIDADSLDLVKTAKHI